MQLPSGFHEIEMVFWCNYQFNQKSRFEIALLNLLIDGYRVGEKKNKTSTAYWEKAVNVEVLELFYDLST